MVHRMSVQLDVPNTPHGRSVYGPVKAHGVPTVELPRPKSRKVARNHVQPGDGGLLSAVTVQASRAVYFLVRGQGRTAAERGSRRRGGRPGSSRLASGRRSKRSTATRQARGRANRASKSLGGKRMGTFSGERDPVLEVTNFGPIVEATVDLRPLTVLVGPSNTGKSYLAILIYALHRFFGGARRDAVPRARSSPLLYGYGWYGVYQRKCRRCHKECTGGHGSDGRTHIIQAERVAHDSPEHIDTMLPEHFAAWFRTASLHRYTHDFGGIMDDEITRCFGVDRSQDLIRRSNGAGEPRGAETRVVLSRYVSEAAGHRATVPVRAHDSRDRVFPHLVHPAREPSADRSGRSEFPVLHGRAIARLRRGSR